MRWPLGEKATRWASASGPSASSAPRRLKDGETFDAVRDGEKIRAVDTIQRTGKKNFHDRIFKGKPIDCTNEMSILYAESVKQVDLTNYKAALKARFWDFTGARDANRVATQATGGMHRDSIVRYVEAQALLLAAINPHFSEYGWLTAMLYSRHVQSNISSTEGNMLNKSVQPPFFLLTAHHSTGLYTDLSLNGKTTSSSSSGPRSKTQPSTLKAPPQDRQEEQQSDALRHGSQEGRRKLGVHERA
ncbi:hypothetical protein HD806DRAFT_529209 [Xylariaceae sp. AK1471]|nr:hypothetical protein HD806DRAFT_529209 [Xylariaceae sp. AK1471]